MLDLSFGDCMTSLSVERTLDVYDLLSRRAFFVGISLLSSFNCLVLIAITFKLNILVGLVSGMLFSASMMSGTVFNCLNFEGLF